jgi:hypothetical protein
MKKRNLLLACPLIFLLIFISCLPFSPLSPIIKIAFCSPADSYGNDINYAEVWQYNGSEYILRENMTSTGGSTRINDQQNTFFNVSIRFNSTFASSTAEAIQYTKVFMNISASNGTSIWLNVELNNTSCELSGSYYYLIERGNWTTTLPEAGVTYNCGIDFQPYY